MNAELKAQAEQISLDMTFIHAKNALVHPFVKDEVSYLLNKRGYALVKIGSMYTAKYVGKTNVLRIFF